MTESPITMSTKGTMATTFKYFTSIIFLTLFIKGYCDCSLNNINIGTARTGREIQGKPEWNVSVINNCNCEQSQITLSCKGFQTAESVDPSIFAIKGDSCLLINGSALKGSDTVNFSYAWDPPFLLLPTSSVLGSCS